jgi:hypothetical protein
VSQRLPGSLSNSGTRVIQVSNLLAACAVGWLFVAVRKCPGSTATHPELPVGMLLSM